MSKDTAMFMIAVAAIMLMCLMGMADSVILALVATLAMVYIVDTEYIRRGLGYLSVTDIVFSVWLATIAAGTLGGLTMAIAAGLMYTVISRELKSAWGAERFSVNGDTGFGKIIVHVTNWATAYLRSSFMSLVKGSKVDAPESLTIEWQETVPAGGWRATRFADALAWMKSLVYTPAL